jgi:hypothetical protein
LRSSDDTISRKTVWGIELIAWFNGDTNRGKLTIILTIVLKTAHGSPMLESFGLLRN